MALMFHRRLAIPLWAIACFTVALAAPPPATLQLPPTTLFVMALAGITLLVFAMPGAFPWLRTSRSLARVKPSIHWSKASAGSAVDGGICVRTPDEPIGHSAASDALDLVRMDDDGGWQIARPPAHAPRREPEQRKKEAGDASAARDTTRVIAVSAACVADRDRADRRSTARSQDVPQYRDTPSERLDGTP